MLKLTPRASYLLYCADPITFLPLRLVPTVLWPEVLYARLRRWWYAAKWRAQCALLGHQFTRRAWVHEETREVGEYHVGCTRCTLFWLETPSFERKTEPRHCFL